MVIIARMRARGDSRGADRMVSIVQALNQRIASINRRLGYRAYSGFAPTSAYDPLNYQSSSLSPLLTGAAPYYGNSNPYYGNPNAYGNNTGYYGNPTTDALVSALPMLFGAH
jgi:hypothetical protein